MENCDVIIPLWEKTKKEDLIKSLNSLIVERNFIKNIFLVIDGCKNYPNYLPTKHVLKSKFNIIYIFKNYGPGYARNCGVTFSKSNNIIFLDAGDRNINNRIQIQLDYLKNNEACFADIEELREKSTILVRKSCSNIEIARKVIAFKTPFNNVTLAIKKKVFEDLGGYPSLRTAEDWVLMGKIIKYNLKIKVIDKVLVSIDIDHGFDSRRRGIKVFKDIIKCLLFNYKNRLISILDLILAIIINFLFRVILPKKIFAYLYRFLRTYFLNFMATFAFRKKPNKNIIKDNKEM